MARIPLNVIASEAASAFGCTLEDLKSTSRRRTIVIARRAAVALLREFRPELAIVEIGRFLYKDHSSIYHAIDKLESSMISSEFRNRIESARQNLRQPQINQPPAADNIPLARQVAAPTKIKPPLEFENVSVRRATNKRWLKWSAEQAMDRGGGCFDFGQWHREHCTESNARFVAAMRIAHPEKEIAPSAYPIPHRRSA